MYWQDQLWWLQAMRDWDTPATSTFPYEVPSICARFLRYHAESLNLHHIHQAFVHPQSAAHWWQKCPQHCSYLTAESSWSSLSKVSWESLEQYVQKPALASFQAPDPGSCISSTWELSALLYINTERHFPCLQIFRPSRSVITGLKKTNLLTLNAAHTYSCIFLSKCVN